jgi:hypothetical protein
MLNPILLSGPHNDEQFYTKLHLYGISWLPFTERREILEALGVGALRMLDGTHAFLGGSPRWLMSDLRTCRVCRVMISKSYGASYKDPVCFGPCSD